MSVTKRAWGLTPGHNSAPFRLPAELGGVGTAPATTILGKTTLGLLTSLREDADGQVLRLMQVEWQGLTETWGTQDVWQIQLGLLALDKPKEHPTLLSQALYSAGLSGVTLEIPGLLPVREAPRPAGLIMQDLETFLWGELQDVWEAGQGGKQLQQAAGMIKELAKKGVRRTEQLKHPTGGG